MVRMYVYAYFVKCGTHARLQKNKKKTKKKKTKIISCVKLGKFNRTKKQKTKKNNYGLKRSIFILCTCF